MIIIQNYVVNDQKKELNYSEYYFHVTDTIKILI